MTSLGIRSSSAKIILSAGVNRALGKEVVEMS
jgi:hypothetical protein